MPLAAAAGFLGATAVVAGVAQGNAPKWHDELPNWIVVFGGHRRGCSAGASSPC